MRCRLLIAVSLAGWIAGCVPTPTPRPMSSAQDAARVAAWWHRKEARHWHYARHHEVQQEERVPACDLTGFKAGCETYGGSGISSCPASATSREGQCSAQAVWR